MKKSNLILIKGSVNNMKIILIGGKAQNGKDTTGNMIIEKTTKKGYKAIRMAYGDLVKYYAKQYFDWNGKKDDYGRYLLQNIGTNRVRENLNMPNYWVDRICDAIKITDGMYDYIVITDCRFPNEIDIPKQLFENTYSIKVTRPNFKSPLTKEQQLHPSEVALDKYTFDYEFINTTLDGLEKQVDKLLMEV